MNYGWLTPSSSEEEYRRVVTHEFGHALGLIHEHQNPAAGINWNKPAVYSYYEGPPNNWTPVAGRRQLFQTYDKDQTQYTQTDPQSIMMYPIDPGLTTDGLVVGSNYRPLADRSGVHRVAVHPSDVGSCTDLRLRFRLVGMALPSQA